jgi:hypothetical protein
MLTKLALVLFVLAGAALAVIEASANPPVCNPPCKSTERCVQLNYPPGQPHPPVCIPK